MVSLRSNHECQIRKSNFAPHWPSRGGDVISRLGSIFLIGLAVVGSLYVAVYLPVVASSGKTTVISYVLNWISDFRINVALAWGTTAACGGWAVLERKKRLRERKERDQRIAELERHIDPNRTSSNLTVAGDKTL